ncbi:perilipin-3-like [Candoia aspera]|uniref:perilipin-3-like n=1 Tax=Candoia aspera TaxID=51853 RepID=UPI002FD7A18E
MAMSDKCIYIRYYTGDALCRYGKWLQCVIRRVADLPLVSSTYEMVSSTYTSARNSHPALQAVLEMAEAGMKNIATSAASTAEPLLNIFEPQIAAANNYACRSLDKLQETFPVMHQTVGEVVSNTKDLITSVKDSAYTKVTKAKDIVSNMIDVAIESAMESMEEVKSAVNTVTKVGVGQMVASGVDKVIEKSEDLLEHFLPITDEELAAIAASASLEGSGVAPLEKQREEQSYYMRLGSLSTKLRSRAYQHSLAKVQLIKQSAQQALFQLEQIIYLLKYTKEMLDQKVHQGQEKVYQMWKEWYKSQPEQGQSSEASQAEMESHALATSHNVAQQMQEVCQKLLANMQGLPEHLQQKVQKAQYDLKELQAVISSATSFQELPSGVLKETSEKINQAQEAMYEVMEYVTKSTPLSWVVGPFSPVESSAGESMKQENA